MLPVQAWPPGSPGASLSPFGKPSCFPALPNGNVFPPGAWVVKTMSNSVVMLISPVGPAPTKTPGTEMLPGSIAPPPPGCCPPCGGFPTYDAELEAFRAWQRKTGRTNSTGPAAGDRPPNWFGWLPISVNPCQVFTLVPMNSGGTVLADGQNVLLTGCGFATIMKAFSV